MDMSISKKDKKLLLVVGALAVGVMYYSFIYSPMSDSAASKAKQKETVQQQYEKDVQDINTLDSRKASMDLLLTKSTEKASKFYPEIAQDKLIDELNTLMTNAGLKTSAITYTNKEVSAVEKYTIGNKKLGEGTIGAIVDSYKGGTAAPSNNSSSSSSSTSSAASTSGATGPTIQQLKVTLTVNSSYDSVKKFLQALESNSKRINVTNMQLSPKSDTDVTGTINLEYYAVPKLDNSDNDYLKWAYNNVYGKDTMFSKGAATGAYNTTVENATADKQYDFVGVLKAPTSTLPPFTFGKSNDDTLATYVYGKSKDSEDVEIDFTEKDGKVYYQYKTDSGKYPDSTEGKEFTPNSDAIEVLLTSEKRDGTDDKSGISLKVVNKSSKQVNITIKDDDATNPRVAAPTTEGNVSVTRK